MLTIPNVNFPKSRSHTNEMQEKSGEAVLAFGSSKGRRAGRQQAEGNKKKVEEEEEKERACHDTMCIYPPDTD